MDKPVEYEFVLPDGSKRYEFVNDNSDIFTFQKMHGATSAAPISHDVRNFKRRYALTGYTVERTPKGWQFCRSGQEKEKGAWSKPYRSVASVSLMIARAFQREIARRDEPYNID